MQSDPKDPSVCFICHIQHTLPVYDLTVTKICIFICIGLPKLVLVTSFKVLIIKPLNRTNAIAQSC